MPTPSQIPPFVNYVAGRLLTVDDYQAEQAYLRAKLRQHNRMLHQPGIVEGLTVTVTVSTVQVSSGVALDAAGNAICVPTAQTVPLPKTSADVYVILRYAEVGIDPIPVLDAPGSPTRLPSRIQEGFAFGYEPVGTAPPVPSPEDLIPPVRLAQLVYVRGRWRLDPTFHRAQAR